MDGPTPDILSWFVNDSARDRSLGLIGRGFEERSPRLSDIHGDSVALDAVLDAGARGSVLTGVRRTGAATVAACAERTPSTVSFGTMPGYALLDERLRSAQLRDLERPEFHGHLTAGRDDAPVR